MNDDVRASDDGRTRSNIRRRRRRTDRSVPVRVRDANFRSADGPSRAKRAVPGRCPLVAVVTPPAAAAAAAARLMCEAKDRSAHSLRSAALNTSATRSRVWTGGVVVRVLDLRLKRSLVRLPAVPLSGNNLGQVVHTHLPLSPSSVSWYRSRGGDALRLGR